MRDLLQKIKETAESLSASTEANQWEHVLELTQRHDGLLRELSDKISNGAQLTASERQLLKSMRELHDQNTEVVTQRKERVAQQLGELTNGKQAISNFKKMNSRKTHFVDFLH